MTHTKRPSIGVIIRLESFGFVLIVIVGSLLHFTYEASGERWWVGVFSAMNESVWEHVKMAFWPAVVWTLLQRSLMPSSNPNFWLAKALALLLMPALIAVGYYAYTAALGRHLLILDIVLFCIAIAIGQLAAVAVQRSRMVLPYSTPIAKLTVAVEALAFSVLGFLPPELSIFIDPSVSL